MQDVARCSTWRRLFDTLMLYEGLVCGTLSETRAGVVMLCFVANLQGSFSKGVFESGPRKVVYRLFRFPLEDRTSSS